MKKITVALCEEQDTYRERLAEYLIHKKGDGICLYTFSEKKQYEEMCDKKSFDIVLFGQGFEGILMQKDTESLYIFLSETPECSEEKVPAVFKYQSAECMMRCVFEYFLASGRQEHMIYKGKKEVIGIYSPCHSKMRTPFALTLGQVISEEKKALYVNLSEWAGFGILFQEEYQKDLSDLLYLCGEHGSETIGLLESVVHSVNRMDYIPPIADAPLLCMTEAWEYEDLLRLLIEKTDYEAILLDFGIMIPGFLRLLEGCTCIYNILEGGDMAGEQSRQFKESMEKSGVGYFMERLEDITFSGVEIQQMEREPVLQQWLYGELGERARAVRQKEYGTD